MEGEVDDLIILYDSSVEITGRLHYKDNLKTAEGSFGPHASFAVLVEKPKKDKIARHYIFARAFGEKLVEKLKRIEKGTFIRVMGELESGYSGTYINVKILSPVSAIELQDMMSKQKPAEKPEEEEIIDEDLLDEDSEEAEDTKETEETRYAEETEDMEEIEDAEKTEDTEKAEKMAEEMKESQSTWSGWKKKQRRGIF
jgi:hypothetical protein